MIRTAVTKLARGAVVLGLEACGYGRGDRAVSGGLLDAGGSAGASSGALASGRDVNLGRPV